MGLVTTPLDELTFRVNGLAMKVQSELKAGHSEKVYQFRLAASLQEAGLSTEIEKRVDVYVNDSLVGYMYIDLWIDQALVVECKAFPHQLTNDEIGQVITYLAATGSPVGLLYNFGRSKLEFKRILPPKNVQEWHKHLYRCVWTPPGHSLPPLKSMTSPNVIRFSVISAYTSSRSAPPTPHAMDEAPSAPIRLSDSRSNPLSDTSAYTAAGVNIDAGNRAVELMRDSVKATYGPEVLAGIGAFGGLYDAGALKGLAAPVLVASTDGVGTKVKVAAQAGRFDSIGQDLVNHCINDILVQGARPLFFLDYVAASRLRPEMIAAVVTGIANACKAAGCALLGGETAEMPGVYQPGEFDVAGTIIGVVERDRILPRPDVQPGDVLLGLRSSGPHTNGYSLIRKVFEGVPLETVFPELGVPLADALLAPHRSYLPILRSPISPAAAGPKGVPQGPIKALAHLTGGGFFENIPRVLPDGVGAVVRPGSWPVLPLFRLIQQHGEIELEEMHRVFNMGIGMVAVVAPENLRAVQEAIGEETFVIGELETLAPEAKRSGVGDRKVRLA
jgi:phosphoribosylformylglycinamidine cyclo-ligase/phosphoribosylamine--glycine ligase/phosphoribosylformylglycinamidine cyclo-ligase